MLTIFARMRKDLVARGAPADNEPAAADPTPRFRPGPAEDRNTVPPKSEFAGSVPCGSFSANADKGKLQTALNLVSDQLYDKLDELLPPESSISQATAVSSPKPEQPSPPLETAIRPTDPDARVIRKNGQVVLGYKDHRAIDDAHGIITATITTDATPDGNRCSFVSFPDRLLGRSRPGLDRPPAGK